MKGRCGAISMFAIGLAGAAVAAVPDAPAWPRASVQTAHGTMRIELYPDEAPLGVASFCFLAREGFYDGLTVHGATADFVVSGDPTATGAGSAGYRLKHEFNLKRKHDRVGVVSLGNQGPGTSGSQFLIDRKPLPRLDGRMTIVGQVVEGIDVLQRLKAGDVIERVRVEGDVESLLARFPAEVAAWEGALALRRRSPEDLQSAAIREVAERGLNVELGYFTETGLWGLDLVEGEGLPAARARQVTLRVGGWLPDGTQFQAADTPLQRIDPRFLVAGVREALQPMRSGGRKIVVVPGPLAYGEQGNPAADIAPNMPLIFEIEVLEVVP